MCGIAGFYSYPASGITTSKEQILAMTNALAHRGPNDSGCVLLDPLRHLASTFKSVSEASHLNQAGVGLGNRRLSILDLSDRGHQPMSDSEGRVWLVFNGEVYNYIELRRILQSQGHHFDSTSDTEVVLRSYLEWGLQCFEKFNGMWGVAIYDFRTGQLILSRDRFGKKPLYYFQDSAVFIFASEIKALHQHPRVQRELNFKKLINYAGRHYRRVDNDNESFFKDILQVPKSSYMVVEPDGKVTCQTYWQLTRQPLLSDKFSEAELVEQFRELLRNAVQIRLRSDVPIGCMLSGGMDSTSITCLAAEHNPDFTAFSAVTGEGYYDESDYIQAVIEQTKVKSEIIYPQPAALFPTLQEMLRFHDEPVCTITWYSLYLITKQIAAAGVPVILTGHGGDELVAGYWDHYHYHFSDLRRAGQDDSAERAAWLANHRRDPAEYERERTYIDRLQQNKQVEIEKFSKYLSALSPDLLNYAHVPDIQVPFEGGLARRLYLELFFETVPPVLRVEDRNTMAHSIEARVPFLDYRLAEFCFSLANNYKIRNGLGKWILREAMKGILPEKVRCRKEKVGHNAPADEWFRNKNRQEIEELIEQNSAVNEIVYSRSKVRELFQEHLAGVNHYMFLWQYINLNLWYNLNFP